jgi:hypothetical protein
MKVLLATYEDPNKAEALVRRLHEIPIPAEVADDSLIQSLIFWAKPFATKKVMVPDQSFDLARAALRDLDRQESVLSGAIRCPECGSPRIEYPQYTRRFMVPLVVELLISLGFAEKDLYCVECHYTWPPKPKPALDPLGWPKNEEGGSRSERPPPAQRP